MELTKFYYVIIKTTEQIESDKGKLKFKTNKNHFLVDARDISHAEKLAKENAQAMYDDFEVISIKQSPIIAVIREKNEEK